MGASLMGRQRGGRRSRAYRPLAEINVTPFVDVMLVLLIIFMVAAPLLTAGIPVNLPRGQASALDAKEDPLWMTVTADGRISLKDKAVFDDDFYRLEELGTRLVAVARNTPDRDVFVRGDRDARYQDIVQVLSEARRSGLANAKLVIEAEAGRPR